MAIAFQHRTLAGGFTLHRYLELSGAVHLMSEAHWNQAMARTVDWLSLHLR